MPEDSPELTGLDHIEELESLRARIAELEQKLRLVDNLTEAERDRLYTLTGDVNSLIAARIQLESENDHYRGLVLKLHGEIEGYRWLMRSTSFAGPGEMCVRPYFGRVFSPRSRTNIGFVIMPFRPEWAEQVEKGIMQALRQNNMIGQRADRRTGREIMKDSWVGMCEAGIVIADVTDRNPNVMYELGLMDAVGQEVILISQTSSPGELPFDLLGHRILVYSRDNMKQLTQSLAERIKGLRPK